MTVRRFLSAGWLTVHALALFFTASFLGLGYWQLIRSRTGNARSFGYALEWPLFAAFVVFMWINFIREERKRARQAEAEPAEPDNTPPDEPVAVPEPAPPTPEAEDEDPELAAYNRYLAKLHAEDTRSRR